MDTFTLIVHYSTSNELYKKAKETLEYIKDEVKKEKGCVQFELHYDITDPKTFVIYETWESKELWQQHLKSKHMIEFNTVQHYFTDFGIQYLGQNN